VERYVTVEEARETMLSSVERVGTQQVMIDRAVGRRVAEPIDAPDDVPAFDNSSRDGYALRYEDVQTEPNREWQVVDTSAAGDAATQTIGGGEAARILTGAPLPDGADTVVMQEDVNLTADGDAFVLEEEPGGRGEWVRYAGTYLEAGECVLRPGDKLGGAEVGLIASLGTAGVSVFRQPRVAVVTAGDELVDVGQAPGPDQIINSNQYQLAALLERAGAEVVRIPRAPDTVSEVRQAFADAISAADLVVSVGGVSVGDRDVVRTVVDELTGGLETYRVRMKPGKPLAFGIAENDASTPMIGVPGNPNSCFVCFQQFVRPVIQSMQGAKPAEWGLRRMTATLETATESTPHRRQYQAGVLVQPDGNDPGGSGVETPSDAAERLVFRPADGQASGDPSLFCGQNALGIVPEDVARLEAGNPITVELLPE
jgi:molybdopterin molybdotransferase